MNTVTNISTVTDYSGEEPIETISNPVITIINDPTPPMIITRFFYCCCCCCCDCD